MKGGRILDMLSGRAAADEIGTYISDRVLVRDVADVQVIARGSLLEFLTRDVEQCVLHACTSDLVQTKAWLCATPNVADRADGRERGESAQRPVVVIPRPLPGVERRHQCPAILVQ